MKPNKCERHQNYKYIIFCPVCKYEKDISEMEKTHVPLSEVNKLVEALKFYKNENNYNLGKIGRWNKTDCGDYFTNDYGQTANKAIEQFNAKYGEKK